MLIKQAGHSDLKEGCRGAGVDPPAVDVHDVLLVLQVGYKGCGLTAVVGPEDNPDGCGLSL